MFDNNIKYCREELEMTQAELGYVFGVSDASVRAWESAKDPMPLVKLIKFCNLYDFSLDYVVGLTRKNISYGKFETDKIKVGNKLKELRKMLNITQQQLADKCKISQTTYSGYETGHYLIFSHALSKDLRKYQPHIHTRLNTYQGIQSQVYPSGHKQE